jgi:CHAT domain-containing protein
MASRRLVRKVVLFLAVGACLLAVASFRSPAPTRKTARAVRSVAWAQNDTYRSPLAAGEVLHVERKSTDIASQIEALEQHGIAAYKNHDWEGAVRDFSRALDLATAAEDSSKQAWLLDYLGKAEQNLGNVQQALKNFERSAERFAALKIPAGEAQARNDVAVLYRTQGRIQDALTSYAASLALWRNPRDFESRAIALCNIAELYTLLGRPQQALGFFNQALALLPRGGGGAVRGRVLSGAAFANDEMGNPRKAAKLYLAARRFLQDLEVEGMLFQRLATLALKRSDKDDKKIVEAENWFHQELDLAQAARSQVLESYARSGLGVAALRRHHPQAALASLQMALALLGPQDTNAEATMLYWRAHAERDLGRLNEARETMESSLRKIEALRGSAQDLELRSSYLSTLHEYYAFYIDLLLKLRHRGGGDSLSSLALEVSERTHARSLLDDIARGDDPPSPLSVAEIQSEVIDPETLLLVYFLGPEHSFLWRVDSQAVEVYELPGKLEIEEAARRAARLLSESLDEKKSREAEKAVKDLSSKVLGPVAGRLGTKRLLVVPDGELSLLPFDILEDPGTSRPPENTDWNVRSLIFDHEVVPLPSASVVGRMRRDLARRPSAPLDLELFADGVFSLDDPRVTQHLPQTPASEAAYQRLLAWLGPEEEPLPRLTDSAEEASGILRLLPHDRTLPKIGFEANLRNATGSDLALFRWIHFATHGMPGDHPDLTGIALSMVDEQGRYQDGILSAPEIYRLHLQADLVVLSACQSASGEGARGEWLGSLTRAFLHAGARRVVVTLWNISDKSTATLMTDFYRRMIQDNRPPAAALREARIALATGSKNKWHSPWYWSGFILQGEPR